MTQDILQQIKASKQDLLNAAFIKLLINPYLKEWYRNFGEGGFDPFCYSCFRSLEDSEGSAPMMSEELIAQPIDKKYYSPEMYSQIIEERKMIARNMLQVNYEPPLLQINYEPPIVADIIMHLHLMWHLYDKGDFLALRIEGMCLDLSFAKLLSMANGLIAMELTKAEREETRNVKPRKTKRENAEKWHSFVLAIYEHGKSITPGTKQSEAVRIIQEQFEESKPRPNETGEDPSWGWIPEKMKTPGRDSIINLFKKEGIRDRDFEKRGLYWFKKA